MARDKIIDVLQSAFGTELGGKRAMMNRNCMQNLLAEYNQSVRRGTQYIMNPR